MKKYSIHVFSGVFFTLLAVSIFNWLINPYDLFTSPEISGLNMYKSEVERHTRLSKLYQLDSVKPDAILLASSRGLVIPDSYLSKNNMPAFNLSLASASTYELLRILQHAQAVKPLKRVILALDEAFTDTVQPNFIEKRLAVNPDGSVNRERWLIKWQDAFSSLVSISALRSSLRTIRKQKENPEAMGFSQYKSKRVYNAGGHHQMFRTMEASVFASYSASENMCKKSLAKVTDMDTSVKHADIFKQIVEFAHKNNIELYVYLSPVHARFYEAKCIVGDWLEMENMKRFIVDTVSEVAVKHKASPFQIWDFSGYNGITTENVPEAGDKTGKMHWYWEGSHYTRETSKLILDKMLSPKKGEYDDFGVRINPDNIERHLLNIRKQRLEYVRMHQDDIEEIQQLINAVVSVEAHI